MPSRRNPLLTVHLPTVVWWTAMTVALAVPAKLADLPTWWPQILHFHALDKVVHLLLFLVAAVLLGRSFRHLGRVPKPLLAALLAAALYGGLTEIGQQMFTDRDGEVADAVADTVGAAAGSLLVAWHARRRPEVSP